MYIYVKDKNDNIRELQGDSEFIETVVDIINPEFVFITSHHALETTAEPFVFNKIA